VTWPDIEHIFEILQALSDILVVLFLVFKPNGITSIKIKKKKKK